MATAMNLSLARVYLRHSDPMVSVRTWQNVLYENHRHQNRRDTGPLEIRRQGQSFDLIRDRILF